MIDERMEPKLLLGPLPDHGGLFVFISGRVCVFAQSLEEPRVLRNEPAHQQEPKHALLILTWFSAFVSGSGNSTQQQQEEQLEPSLMVIVYRHLTLACEQFLCRVTWSQHSSTYVHVNLTQV